MDDIEKLPDEVENPSVSEEPLPADPIILKINELIDMVNAIKNSLSL